MQTVVGKYPWHGAICLSGSHTHGSCAICRQPRQVLADWKAVWGGQGHQAASVCHTRPDNSDEGLHPGPKLWHVPELAIKGPCQNGPSDPLSRPVPPNSQPGITHWNLTWFCHGIELGANSRIDRAEKCGYIIMWFASWQLGCVRGKKEEWIDWGRECGQGEVERESGERERGREALIGRQGGWGSSSRVSEREASSEPLSSISVTGSVSITQQIPS